MKTIIIDDDKAAVDTLAAKLKPYPDMELLGTAATSKDGIELARATQPEIIFLDVELPDMTGLEFLDNIGDVVGGWCSVVMYSAHSHYMLPSFRRDAFDYLLKPVSDHDLAEVIERLREKRRRREPSPLAALGKSGRQEGKLAFYMGNADFKVVLIRDICVFEYNHDQRLWEALVVGSDKPMRLKRNVSCDDILAINGDFVQVSQKFIINVGYLMEVVDGTCHFYPPFDTITHVRVGRQYRKRLIDRFGAL